MRWPYWSLQKNGTGAYGAAGSPAAAASRLRAACRALLGRVGPVLDAHLLAEQRVGPAADVAGGVDAGRAGGEGGVAHDAVAQLEPAALQPAGGRRDPDADDDHVGRHDRAVA